MSRLSVVIPTHHRPEILRHALEHLAKQTIASDLQIIVVHDGEDDTETKKAVSSTQYAFASFDYFSIPKSQQGVARNRGVDRATAPLVLFSQDDIFLAPDACEIHVRTHEDFPGSAVLGYTTWDPACDITPVMEWLEQSGWQFGYPKIEQYAHTAIPSDIQHSFTYTSHISVPTEVATKIRFIEDISLYGWEDMEWGMRLKENTVPLIYEHDAKALHHHHMELSDSLKRMQTLGQSAVMIETMNPDLRVTPRGLKAVAYWILARFSTMRGRHLQAFLKGMAQQKHLH